MLPLSESRQYVMGPDKITVTFIWKRKETGTAKRFGKCRSHEKVQPVLRDIVIVTARKAV